MRIAPNEAMVSSFQNRVDAANEAQETTGEQSLQSTANATSGQAVGGVSFGDILGGVVENANRMDHIAAQKVDELARGTGDDLHGTMIATKEADISVHLVGTIRNKLLDAFQEIWRTSV